MTVHTLLEYSSVFCSFPASMIFSHNSLGQLWQWNEEVIGDECRQARYGFKKVGYLQHETALINQCTHIYLFIYLHNFYCVN